MIPTKMELKLSSNNMIPAASLAISVPSIPIAIPTSALFNAGASLVPSPVTATILPNYLNPLTNKYLSLGVHLDNILNSFIISLNTYIFYIIISLLLSSFYIISVYIIFLNSSPSII